MPTNDEIQQVWEKGRVVRGKKPNLYRKDDLGNEIYRPSYGKETPMGWEIDHKKPKSKGGSDSVRNKRPLQSGANARKSDKYPHK